MKNYIKATAIQTILVLVLSVPSRGQDKPNIRFGDQFGKWQKSFKSIGASSNGKCASYEYTKSISTLYYGHKVAKLLVSVHDNIVVRQVLLFTPNSNDIDVPKPMLEAIESNLGHKLSRVDNAYGLKIDGTLITVSRMNNGITEGLDRIMMMVAGVGACK